MGNKSRHRSVSRYSSLEIANYTADRLSIIDDLVISVVQQHLQKQSALEAWGTNFKHALLQRAVSPSSILLTCQCHVEVLQPLH